MEGVRVCATTRELAGLLSRILHGLEMLDEEKKPIYRVSVLARRSKTKSPAEHVKANATLSERNIFARRRWPRTGPLKFLVAPRI